VPPGGEDEYRSVVFDESFVRAARIQEYSAQERLDDAAHAVRVRHAPPHPVARQALATFLLIMVAFGIAVYMGVRHPYKAHNPAVSEQIRVHLIPLVPGGTVPAVSATEPFADSRAAGFPVGAAGIVLRPADRVGGFAQSEVQEALSTAKQYLTYTSLTRDTVIGGDLEPVRELLDRGQQDEFDATLSQPRDDGSHEATGWLVRFDPTAQITLVGADNGIRTQGDIRATGANGNQLEVVSDHTVVYALHGRPDTGVSLFTVRRRLTFHFDHADLRQHHIELAYADVQAGPLACNDSVGGYFQPILAGEGAAGRSSANPYDRHRPAGAVCATLDPGAAGAAATPPATPATHAPAGTPTGDRKASPASPASPASSASPAGTTATSATSATFSGTYPGTSATALPGTAPWGPGGAHADTLPAREIATLDAGPRRGA
jgi:hypothetical protein